MKPFRIHVYIATKARVNRRSSDAYFSSTVGSIIEFIQPTRAFDVLSVYSRQKSVSIDPNTLNQSNLNMTNVDLIANLVSRI